MVDGYVPRSAYFQVSTVLLGQVFFALVSPRLFRPRAFGWFLHDRAVKVTEDVQESVYTSPSVQSTSCLHLTLS